MARLRARADLPGYLVAVHVRHPEIQEYGRRVKRSERVECGVAVVGDVHLGAEQLQNYTEAVGGVPVVVHYQDTRQSPYFRNRNLQSLSSHTILTCEGQSHNELASSACARAVCRDTASIHLHQA